MEASICSPDELPRLLQRRDRKPLLDLIKRCAENKDLVSARRIQAELSRSKLFVHDLYAHNALLSLYSKCGALAAAQHVFDELRSPNVVSWNALISAYVHHGHSDQALLCFERMRDQGFSPNEVTFTCILKVCGDRSSLEMGEEIHAEITKNGMLQKDVLLGSTLVNMYAKCGALEKAQEVFESLPFRDVACWNSLIFGYALNGLGEEARHLIELMLQQGVLPSIATYTSILQGCGRGGLIKTAEESHMEIRKRGLFGKDILISNSLIDMYAKLSLLAKAEEVFYELPLRNVVSWNSLISGYVQNGQNHEALSYFKKMQDDEGVNPNAITYVGILKACGSTGSLKMGEEIHANIKRAGLLQRDIMVGTALVDMYAKCGMLEKAQEVFEDLPNRNVVTWSALIAGYTRNGLGDEALECFRRMQDEGISPNAITFICILKACGSTESIHVGEEIHAEVTKQGLLGKDVVLTTALIDMYSKCGALRKSQEIFDKIQVRNVICWNSLISGYVEHEHVAQAHKCFRQMEEEGVLPDAVTFISILKSCSRTGSLEMGKEIHTKANNQGLLENDILLGTTLVDMYAKCGMLKEAQEVFNKFPIQNVVSWNALIAGYTQHGFSNEALACFKQMQDEGISPNSVTFISILKACGSLGYLEMGQEIHAEVDKQELLGKDAVLATTLVDMYAKCGMLSKACEVFEQLPVQDVVSWNTLVTGYTQHGFHEKALENFKKMLDHGILPDSASFICILKACTDADKVDEIRADIKKHGLLEKNIMLGSTLIDMYAKYGVLVKAQEVFDELPLRDVVCWNTLITGYTQHGFIDEALVSFKQMRDEGIAPDLVTFVCVLKACSSIGSLNIGEDIHAMVTKQGLLYKSIALGNTLVDMYAKCCVLTKAQEVFDELPVRDVVSWNALITGYAQLGEAKKVFNLLCRMVSEDIFPNVVTFLVLLTVCSYGGHVEEGQEILDIMNNVYHLPPTLEHLACMVDLFGRTRNFEKAVDVIETVASSDQLPLWLALLGTCAKWVNLELARWAFEQAIHLDENCAAPYVSMGNIYAATDMHERAKHRVLREV